MAISEDARRVVEGAIPAVTTVCLVWLLYKILDGYRRFRAFQRTYNSFPGERDGHWLLGNIIKHPGPGQDGLDYQHSKVCKYPTFFRVWASIVRCIVIFQHPTFVKQLLKSSAPKPRKMGSVYVLGIKWLGEGLLIANGGKWARNRRLLTPAFHFEILQPYVAVFNQAADILREKCEDVAKTGETMEAFAKVELCSLDIILRCAFSFQSECQSLGSRHPYVKAVARLTEIWMKRSLNPLYFPDWVFFNMTFIGREFLKNCKYVHDVADDLISKRRQTLTKEELPDGGDTGSRKRHLDFLDILLTARDDEGRGLSDLEIRQEVDTFLFEGHDTTASAISFTLFSLAQHPEIQSRVQEEIDRVLDGRQDMEWKDLAKFEYLTMCIKEGLRLHCPVFFMMRETVEDISVEGYTIPAGTDIAVDINNLHHNPAVWGEDMWEFKPDRFLSENIDKMDPFAFVPFSAGSRNCIGQNFAMIELKIVLVKLLQRFTFREEPGHVVRKKMGIVMRTENGIRLKVARRE